MRDKGLGLEGAAQLNFEIVYNDESTSTEIYTAGRDNNQERRHSPPYTLRRNQAVPKGLYLLGSLTQPNPSKSTQTPPLRDHNKHKHQQSFELFDLDDMANSEKEVGQLKDKLEGKSPI